ncbi:MAG TPA: thioredoxin family protein [Isosphaeraceae bacterium]|jgi:thioredoxin-related protein|nr:thioredoxin family protein [Isosphaeraceae bacterium]
MNVRPESRLARLALGLAVVVAFAPPGRAGAAEDAAKASKDQKEKLYDPKADAKVQVAEATAKARRDNTRVLVMFGGDWCGWCHKLHALLKSDPAIRKTMLDEYVLVSVDTKSPNADELLERCKAALSKEELARGVGFPFLAVLDANGKVVKAQQTDPLEDGDHHDPARVRAFLKEWTAPQADADAKLEKALAEAKSKGKMVFLHFGAPWCGWCHRLDDFLARPDVAEVVGRDFVMLKVDTDRDRGGSALWTRFNPARGGIPWFAFLDADGKALTTSDGPRGNIGYPATPEEIAHFLKMLETTHKGITKEQIDALGDKLRAAAPKL